MANANLKMDSYFDWPNHLIFTIEIKKQDYIIGYKEVDLITFAEESLFWYSTLESSKIDKRSEKQIQKEMKDIYKKEIIEKIWLAEYKKMEKEKKLLTKQK
jgi:hypothetical protein